MRTVLCCIACHSCTYFNSLSYEQFLGQVGACGLGLVSVFVRHFSLKNKASSL